MSIKRFPPNLVEALNSNPNVRLATAKSIQFEDRFKADAVDSYLAGKPVREIFEDAGFDVDAVGMTRIRAAMGSWARKQKAGKPLSSKRGKPVRRELTDKEKIARLESENAMLRQEVEFLRQIRRLERRHQPSKSPSEKGSRRSTGPSKGSKERPG